MSILQGAGGSAVIIGEYFPAGNLILSGVRSCRKIAMLCPIDDIRLEPASTGGYQIHRCPQCQGVSLGGTVLREVRAHMALRLHKHKGVAGILPCPSDGKAMKALEYKGVQMCACPQCLGLWLGAAQFSLLQEVIEPPKQADLSKIGRGLSTISDHSIADSVAGIGELLEFASDVLDVIGEFRD